MTMKHWCALGTVPSQCWLKAVSSLQEQSSVYSGKGQNGENQTVLSRSLCFFHSWESTVLRLFSHFWKLQSSEQKSYFHCRRAIFVLLALPQCMSSFPESAKKASQHLQGPQPQDNCSHLESRANGLLNCASKTRLPLLVLSWQTAHKKQTWSSLCDGKAWWQGPTSSPCTLERWEG